MRAGYASSALGLLALVGTIAPPARAQPAYTPAPSAPMAPTGGSRVVIADVAAAGLDPAVAPFVRWQVQKTAEAMGYGTIPADASASASASLGLPPAPSPYHLWQLTKTVGAERGIFVEVRAKGTEYQLAIAVASADGTGPYTTKGEAAAHELAPRVDALLRTVLPVPADAPTWDGGFPRFRIALQAEAALGVSVGPFTNYLAGARFDYRFSRTIALGAYLAYANLKGKSGRADNVLPYGMIEYRPRFGSTDQFSIPLRYAAGYLPRNGPFLRLSAGLGVAVSERVEIAADLVTPTFWISRDLPVISFDFAAEVSVAF